MGKIGEGAIEKSCFSIFFCGCNQLKSFHNGGKGNIKLVLCGEK